jgi:hypothetical protein
LHETIEFWGARLMPVAYFDTSHLHLLATERSRNTAEFSAFLEYWQQGGWELALSHVHFLELARYGGAEGRAARYALFQDLAPVWLTLPVRDQVQGGSTLTRREIRHALAARGLAKPSQTVPGRHGIVFVERVDSNNVHVVQALEGDELRRYIQLFHGAVSLAAEASRRPPDAEPPGKRLRDIENRVPTPEQVQAIRDAVERETAQAFAGLGMDLPAEAREQALAQVRGQLDAFLTGAAQHGVQVALAQFLASAGAEPSARSPVQTLIHEHVFADEVRRTLLEDLGVTDEALLQQGVRQLKLAECPGTWLSREVSKSLAAAEHAPEPGSTYDLEHLGYLPYVDVLFADKRIAEFTRQVLRRDGLPQMLAGVRPPRAIPNSLDAIRGALQDSVS